MRTVFKIVLLCFLFLSCKETPKRVKQKSIASKPLINKEIDSVSEKKETEPKEDIIKLKFPDLTFLLIDINMNGRDKYNRADNSYETKQDTAYFDLSPGDWTYEKSLKIEKTEFEVIEMYGQYEIKIGIDTKQDIEVPFKVLEDWKKYTSEWKKLEIDTNDLKFPDVEVKDDRPIDFTLDELKLEVKRYCEPEWFDEIKNIKSLDKIPFHFFETRYIYRIKIKNSKTQEILEKYIVFYTPTSC